MERARDLLGFIDRVIGKNAKRMPVVVRAIFSNIHDDIRALLAKMEE